jgi:hypothetical protein
MKFIAETAQPFCASKDFSLHSMNLELRKVLTSNYLIEMREGFGNLIMQRKSRSSRITAYET